MVKGKAVWLLSLELLSDLGCHTDCWISFVKICTALSMSEFAIRGIVRINFLSRCFEKLSWSIGLLAREFLAKVGKGCGSWTNWIEL